MVVPPLKYTCTSWLLHTFLKLFAGSSVIRNNNVWFLDDVSSSILLVVVLLLGLTS